MEKNMDSQSTKSANWRLPKSCGKALVRTMMTLALFLTSSMEVRAQDYQIGSDDVLVISFWQQPDLNNTVTVRQDGKITMPIIGEIIASGLTASQLASRIVEKMSFYSPNISQATVVVSGFNSRRVFVTGQVTSPGRLSFEVFPNLWEAIKQAGGPTEAADLSRVRIIRGDSGKIENIDLDNYLQKGNSSGIPLLSNNDNVDVPRYALSTEERIIPHDFEGRKVCFIYGAVARPGPLNLDSGMDVLEAIVLAGGPLPDAKLSNVRIIRKVNEFGEVTKVNIDRYSKYGQPPRIQLKSEDTVVVPRGRSFWGGFVSTMRDVLPIVVATSSTIIAISAYNDRGR
ncbi:MAG: hypothetical protein CO189_03875 [candidate division Zixibacteria bacterium CG_4_9_14_3_um_filter_46_8]|nr:MAG: hypothetical protein CO189_03875 [candidate division Zixibacteria bacterium CG_4_9_14_3_um_filter_46_8]